MTNDTNQDDPFDVIIIGAGVIGASIALGLTRRGLKTLNIDTLPAAGYGSTSNSSAIVRPFYSAVESCALAHEARHRWLNWPEFLNSDDESGFARYDECGMLILMSEGDEQRFKPSLQAMTDVGIKFSHLTTDEISESFPLFEIASFSPPRLTDDPNFGVVNEKPLTGGYQISAAGYVNDPQLAAHNLQRAAEALGAVFKFNTRVVAINKSDDRVLGITTNAGDIIAAEVVVNVAGPHSSKINLLAGIEDEMVVSTQPARHEVAHVQAPTDSGANRISCVVGDGDAGVYFRPEMGSSLLVGSLDPDCDAKEFVDADDYNTALTEQWTRQVWRAALRIPSLAIPNTAQGVVGLYDATPDWNPIYDKSSLPGYYMAIGTSGNQFKNAPVIGDLMAELITACEAGQDHDIDPVQFYLPDLKRSIDIGFYSRNRVLHKESSGTVLA
jgi:sarcosine oxidase subunit beta